MSFPPIKFELVIVRCLLVTIYNGDNLLTVVLGEGDTILMVAQTKSLKVGDPI